LAKCGSIFLEFQKSLKTKREKNPKTAYDSKEYEKNRTRNFSAKWQVGRRGALKWQIAASGALKTNKPWCHRMC